MGVHSIVNLQTETMVEQWGSERQEESDLQKEAGEWSVSRKRRKEKTMMYFPVLGYLKRLPVVFVL